MVFGYELGRDVYPLKPSISSDFATSEAGGAGPSGLERFWGIDMLAGP